MGSGYRSLHPYQEAALRKVGITDDLVTQGVGYASASGGTHAEVGHYGRRAWGWCADIAWGWAADWSGAKRDHLLAAGWLPFRRYAPQWAGSLHLHLVYAGPLPGQEAPTPEWVNVQRYDYLHDLNGLVRHAPLTQECRADEDQKAMLRDLMAGHEVLYSVTIAAPNGVPVPCHAFLQENVTRCEVRLLAEALGWSVLYAPTKPLAFRKLHDLGQIVASTPEWHVRYEGDYARCDARALIEGLGRSLAWNGEKRTIQVV